MKVCNSCGLPDKIFTKDSRNKDGLQGCCNECKNLKRKGTSKHNPKYNAASLKRELWHSKTISDKYVIAELKRGTTLTTEDLKKHPELIELKRQIIKTKRKIKDEKRKRSSQ